MKYVMRRRNPLCSTSSKRRAAHDRCPNCKKVRKIWMRSNQMNHHRVSSMNITGEGKVCWVCRIRAVQSDWRPGLPIPEISDPQKFVSLTSDEFKIYTVMES